MDTTSQRSASELQARSIIANAASAPDDPPLLTPKELLGWGLFGTGAALGITAAYLASGLIAAIGALGASCTAAAAVLGVSAARNTTQGGRQ